MKLLASLTALLAVLSGWLCAAEQPPVTVYTFELKAGQSLQAYRFTAMGANELKSYLLTTLEGQKLILLEKEIVSRKEELIPLETLPEKARKEILNARAMAAAARAEAEAQEKEQQAISAARRKESEARNELKKASEDYALAKTVLGSAEKIVKDTPVEIARLDARYDAAKTELGGLSASYVGGYGVDHSRADYLRELMTKAAEDKVRLEQGKKEAQDIIGRMPDTTKALEARMGTAKKDMDVAQAELKLALHKANQAAKEREKARGEVAREGFTLLTLKDGKTIRATSVVEDPDGRVAAKDDQGLIHYFDSKDIIRREKARQ